MHSPAKPTPLEHTDLETRRRERLESFLREQRRESGQVQPARLNPPGLRRPGR